MKPEKKGNKKVPGKSARPASGTKAFSYSSGWPLYLGVFLLAFLLYAGTLGHDYVLDDNGVIQDNWVVKKGLSGIPLILSTPYRYGVSMLEDNLYRPLSLVMFAAEWQAAPGKPFAGHFINVLFYALTCALLYLTLKKVFRRFNPAVALFVSILWMTHPVHTEVVANIKSRDEIMSVFLLVLSVYWLLSYSDSKKTLTLAGSLVAFFLALMSKEGVITGLAVIPLVGWFSKDKFTWADLRISLLFLIPAVFYLLIRHAVLSAWATPATNTLIDNLLLAAPDFQSRLATAFLLLGKYLWVLLLPVQLVSDYSYNQIPVTTWSYPLAWLSFAVYAGALVFAAMNIRKRTLLSFGILFYLLTMSIYSNLFMLIGSSFAERFLYLPSLGFCIVLAVLILQIFRVDLKNQNFEVNLVFRKLRYPGMILLSIIVLYGMKTIARNRDWKDEYTLFAKDVEKSPNSAHMRLYWGTVLRDRAKAENDPALMKEGMGKALEEFKMAAAIYPSYPDAWQQIGLAYYRLGDNERSMESYQKALSLNPGESTTYANMGIIYFQSGDYPKAIELYRRAIQLDPNYADAYFNLGSSYGTVGEFSLAVENFQKCLELDPENARACYFLGITYRSLNNEPESRRYLERAGRLDPNLIK